MPNADNTECRRKLTFAEIDLLISAWGCNAVWRIPLHVYEGEARVEFDTDDVKGTLKMYWPEDATDAMKVHEAGHAAHLALYSESATWPTFKCETFAMLGVVRLKLDGVYGPRPEIVAAAGLLKREPARYDRVMELAAKPDDGDDG